MLLDLVFAAKMGWIEGGKGGVPRPPPPSRRRLGLAIVLVRSGTTGDFVSDA